MAQVLPMSFKKWCRRLLALRGGILASLFCHCDTLWKNHSHFYPFEILHPVKVTLENFVQWMAHSFPFKRDINSSWKPLISIYILDIRYPDRRIPKTNQPGSRINLFKFMLSMETKGENTILQWEIIWNILNLITKLWLSVSTLRFTTQGIEWKGSKMSSVFTWKATGCTWAFATGG